LAAWADLRRGDEAQAIHLSIVFDKTTTTALVERLSSD
jgi:hypothetical protein